MGLNSGFGIIHLDNAVVLSMTEALYASGSCHSTVVC